MDIGKCFKDAWGLFRLDLGPLVATAVIAAVVLGGSRRKRRLGLLTLKIMQSLLERILQPAH